MKLEECPNLHTFEAAFRCNRHLYTHSHIMVSISGGADSDDMLDLIMHTVKSENIPLDKIHFVFFNTGIEYAATLKHLDELETKYGITIERHRAITPVPLGCKKYGLPFLSKRVSNMISRLQKHNFDFAGDGSKGFDELYVKYPKCRCALKWWCNEHENLSNRKSSQLNISYNAYLKDFMIANPPTFKISEKCCQGAKKDNAHKLIDELRIDLNVVGIRKAEGGERAISHKTCFEENKNGIDNFFPLFWFTEQDKREYEAHFGVTHSDCYIVYGLKRTGCAGCPFGKDFEAELENAKQFEPKLYTAINNIFHDSYEYTRAYYKYRAERKDPRGGRV